MTSALVVYEVSFSENYYSSAVHDESGIEVAHPEEVGSIGATIHNFSTYMEYIMLTYVVVNFLTPYKELNGLLCKNIKSIAIRYSTY